MVDIIFAIGALLISISYLATNMLILRLISAVGALAYIIAGLLAGYNTAGMKALIGFSLLNLGINIIQSIKLYIEEIPIQVPKDLQELYSKVFNEMTTNEFMKLYQYAQCKSVPKDELILKENEPVTQIILIKKGEVNIKQKDQVIATLSQGYFLGEMSYLAHTVATASVQASSNSMEYIYWEQKFIAELKIKNTMLYIKLENAIANDLIRKIMRQVKER